MAIPNLKLSNCWKRKTFGAKLQKNRKNQGFSDNWKHGGVIITCTLLENQRPVRGWNQVVSETKASKMQETIKLKIFSPRKNTNFHILGVNKDSPLLSKDFKVYWLSHLLKNLNVPNRSQQEKNEIFKSDITKRNLAILNLKRSTCSIWESFQRTVLQEKNSSPGKIGYRKHGWVVIRTDEGAGSTVGTGGKIFFAAAHEKHVSNGFDRSA